MSAPQPEVSVVVPVHQAARTLPALLERLERQTLDRARFEVLIVDDASRDGTAEVAAASPVTRVIRTDRNAGSYAARNRGIVEARGRHLAFTDGDCLPALDWLEQGLRSLAESDADLVAGRVDIVLGERPRSFALLDAARHLDQRSYASRGYGATANLWVRRQAIERHGSFNARLRAGGDAEFGRRAVAGGARLVYSDAVRVEHPARSGIGEFLEKEFRYGYSLAQRRFHVDPAQPLLWLHPRAYRFSRRIDGLERLAERGYEPSPARRSAMLVQIYLFCRLPRLAGNCVGTLSELRRAG